MKLFPFVNASSGGNIGEDLTEWFTSQVPADRLGRITVVQKGDHYRQRQQEALSACEAEAGLLLLCGGDGTINSFLKWLHERQQPFAVIPSGTFNLFARDHSIPLDRNEALKLALNGEVRAASMGWVNDQPFIVSAGLGLHPRIIERREQAIKRFGRNRWVAGISSLITAIRFLRPIRVVAETPERTYRIRTPLVLASLSRSQLQPAGVPCDSELRSKEMLLCFLKVKGVWDVLATIWAGLVHGLGGNPHLFRVESDSIRLRVRQSRMKACVDGEIMRLDIPMSIRLEPDALQLVYPLPETARD